MIRFGREICCDLEQAERREWWLSNGLGAYAAGNIAGSLTRRYHGLLVTPLDGALDRHLLLSKADATLEVDGQMYPLNCNRWLPGTVSPKGYTHIESFRLDGQLPVWTYAVAGVRLEHRIFMEQGEAAVWVAFRLLDASPDSSIKLHLRLLVNYRDHHGQTVSGSILPHPQLLDGRRMQLGYVGTHQLHMQLSTGEFQLEQHWINNFLLTHERERGLADVDNHLAIATAVLPLQNRLHNFIWHGLRAGLSPCSSVSPSVVLQGERFVQHDFLHSIRQLHRNKTPAWIEQLILNSKQFIFRRTGIDGTVGESIIAGYPWFGDWGRDTMIALPGLTLCTGQLSVARQILETWSTYVDGGMIPNRFPESSSSSTPEYNSVDASLWFILAWFAYWQAGGKKAALIRALPVLEDIIQAYQHGTRYQIHMDEANGLLHIGEAGTQLTWMDARVNGIAATPRTGKPVEINALWYNALRIMQQLTEQLKIQSHVSSEKYAAMAEKTRQGFQRYIRADGGLYDVLDSAEGDDESIRPNQIFALSLYWSLLEENDAQSVLAEVKKHLLTSYGLRSLSAQDPAYCGAYIGSVAERDGAYHNGTSWSWLSGHFSMAHFRVHADADAALSILQPFRHHLSDAGLGSISEIFDGEPPHLPRGAPCQAWSVATILQAWCLITGDNKTAAAKQR